MELKNSPRIPGGTKEQINKFGVCNKPPNKHWQLKILIHPILNHTHAYQTNIFLVEIWTTTCLLTYRLTFNIITAIYTHFNSD